MQRYWVFAGGGTGGHLFPGVAVGEEILHRDPEARIEFWLPGTEVEERCLRSTPFSIRRIRSSRIPAGWFERITVFPFRLFTGWIEGVRRMREDPPDGVIGLGGFASFPALAAALFLGIPVTLMEQNRVVGKVNRWTARYAKRLFLAWPGTPVPAGSRAVVTGNPVRFDPFPLRPWREPKTILVIGGSLGAGFLNRWVPNVLLELRDEEDLPFRVIHLSGEVDRESVVQAYRESAIQAEVMPYTDRMQELYREGDWVICRAGGTGLAEVAAAGLPSSLVPLPIATEEHQKRNAELFAERGAALLWEQEKVTAGGAARELALRLRDPDAWGKMSEAARSLARPAAAREIVDTLL